MLQGLLSQMVEKELADKERDRQIAIAQETADKAVATTESIKEAVKPVFDNWRSEINLKFNRIQRSAGAEFRTLRSEMYLELERRAGCDLNTRLRNKRNRMTEEYAFLAGRVAALEGYFSTIDSTFVDVETVRKILGIEEEKKNG